MKILVISDLHHEFGHILRLEPQKDVTLILAGDIDSRLNDLVSFITAVSNKFKNVVMVAGNHEYYHSPMNTVDTTLEGLTVLLNNFFYLNNSSIVLDGQKILGTTLWTNRVLNPSTSFYWHDMNDSRLIRKYKKEHLLTNDDVFLMNKDARHFLSAEVEKDCIIVTHHAPTEELVDPKYKGNIMNCFYYNSGLEHLFEYAKLWCYGHTHKSVDANILGCRFICNPHGYMYREVNNLFDKYKVLDV